MQRKIKILFSTENIIKKKNLPHPKISLKKKKEVRIHLIYTEFYFAQKPGFV